MRASAIPGSEDQSFLVRHLRHITKWHCTALHTLCIDGMRMLTDVRRSLQNHPFTWRWYKRRLDRVTSNTTIVEHRAHLGKRRRLAIFASIRCRKQSYDNEYNGTGGQQPRCVAVATRPSDVEKMSYEHACGKQAE